MRLPQRLQPAPNLTHQPKLGKYIIHLEKVNVTTLTLGEVWTLCEVELDNNNNSSNNLQNVIDRLQAYFFLKRAETVYS